MDAEDGVRLESFEGAADGTEVPHPAHELPEPPAVFEVQSVRADGILRDLLDEMGEGVYFADANRRILLWNRAAESISGFDAAFVVGRSCANNVLVHTDAAGNNLCETVCPLRKAAERGTRTDAEVYLRHRDGHRVPVRVSVFPAYDSSGNLLGAFELFNESASVMETRRRLLHLEEMAFVDSLTRLANRRYLDAKLETFLEEHRRHGWQFGVLLFDLDRFKQLNDSYGHARGDEVLRSVGNTLANAARTIDVIGRWGGEEFAGLFRGLDRGKLEMVAERLRGLVASISVPCEEGRIRPTVSVGATMVRPEDTASSIFDRADEALYRAKESGRNRVVILD